MREGREGGIRDESQGKGGPELYRQQTRPHCLTHRPNNKYELSASARFNNSLPCLPVSSSLCDVRPGGNGLRDLLEVPEKLQLYLSPVLLQGNQSIIQLYLMPVLLLGNQSMFQLYLSPVLLLGNQSTFQLYLSPVLLLGNQSMFQLYLTPVLSWEISLCYSCI